MGISEARGAYVADRASGLSGVLLTRSATAEMRKYFSIAWETDAWCADNPSHLIHFNGERFLGPYA